MKRFGIILLLAVFMFNGCSSTPKYISVYADVELTLNEGEKWVVPDEMKAYIDSSMMTLSELDKKETLTSEQIIGLKRQKEGFVSHCSMEGKGHDVLHAWLIPYMDLLSLLNADDTELSSELRSDLLKARSLFVQNFK